MPVTTPAALILATAELEVVQTPPGVVLESVMLEPTHKDVNPEIGSTGQGLQLLLGAKVK